MEPIAVIGLSFKLPQGIEDTSSLWDILKQGKNVMTPWPEDRTSIKGFLSANSSQVSKLHSVGGHFITDRLGAFDAPFFSISSKEAAAMDPQQHILLETSYKALENAGIPLYKVAGTAAGVFAGSMSDDYSRLVAKDPDEAALHAATGQTMAMLANRLSWFFDMKGPSVHVNTVCSSSMIAVDLACQSLRSGQSSLALVAGSSIMLGPEMSLYLSNMNVLSPDSLSYSFDHRANGYSRGDGVIVFVLKRLSDAVTDGDMIRAVIRGSGSNQDGHTPGITQPSISSQEDLIRTVYKGSGVGFESTMYVEAHGTGTQLGDSSEAKALGRVFKSSRSPRSPLYIGSIKTNIGHLEGGSGLAGMLKSILILEKGIIPPNALFEKLNPKINAKALNIQVPTSCVPWPSRGLRRISVNSFGFGGSNGHVILDDAYHCLQELGLQGNHQTQVLPAQVNSLLRDNVYVLDDGRRPGDALSPYITNDCAAAKPVLPNFPMAIQSHKLLIWSAKDEGALRRMTEAYATYMQNAFPDQSLLSYTLAVKRSHLTWRSFGIIHNSSLGLQPRVPLIRSSRDVSLAFVFTGQGAQYAGMGLELLAYPIFNQAMERANAAYHDLGATWSIYDVFQDEGKINDPQLSQPLCTALQLGLVELLRSFNIMPAAVVGHSSGEIAAAYTVGALSFQSACKVAYHRGRLASLLATAASRPEAMMSVNLSEGQVQPYLRKIGVADGHIYVACVNSHLNVTLSGEEIFIDILKTQLDKDGIFASKLKTGVGYHSPAMQEIASEYSSSLGVLEKQVDNEFNILMVSSSTGETIPKGRLSDSQYWVENLVSPVRFYDALQYLELTAPRVDGIKPLSTYLEVGPSGALRRPLCDTINSIATGKQADYVSILSKFDSPITAVMNMAGQLFTRGHRVSITAVNQQAKHQASSFLVDLPAYPFDHSQNYWQESRLSRDWRLRETAWKTLLGVRTTDWNPLEPRWRAVLSIHDIPWIAHHIIGDVPYVPGTGILMAALEAVKQTAQAHQLISGFIVKDIIFMSPVVVRPEGKTEVITQLRSLHQGHEKSNVRFEVRIFACVDSYWNECSRAIIHVEYTQDLINEVDGGRETQAATQASIQAYEDAKRVCVKPVSKSDFYTWHTEQGLRYGPSFSLTEGASWDGGELGIGSINTAQAEPFDGIVHPGVLDCAFQVSSTATSCGMTRTMPTMIIHRLQDVWISSAGWQHPDTHQIRVLGRSKMKPSVPGIDCCFTILDDSNTLLCRVKKFEMLPAGARGHLGTSSGGKHMFYSIAWKPQLSELSRSQLHDLCHDFGGFFELALHQSPRQTLLEIGAGSASMLNHTLSILERFEETTGGIAFTEYHYMQASKPLLEEVREKYEAHHMRDRLRFGVLNMEKDPEASTLQQGTYETIIIAEDCVLNGRNAKGIAPFMRGLRRALKLGGYLVIHGFTGTDLFDGFDNTQSSSTTDTITTKMEWEQLLNTTGFSLTFSGPKDPTVIILAAAEEPAATHKHEILLLVDDQQAYQNDTASLLLMTADVKDAEVVSISQLSAKSFEPSQRKSVIFLADLDASFLVQMPEVLFTPLKLLIENTTSILWVTSVSCSGQNDTQMPFSGLKDGFLRSIQSEYAGKRIISLSLEGTSQAYTPQEAARYITQVFKSGFITTIPELEYVVRDGVLHSGRLVREVALDERVGAIVSSHSMTAGPRLVKTDAWNKGPALQVQIGNPGSLETLRLVQDNIANTQLEPTEVEIEAKSWSLNFRDLFIALGRLDETDFGMDCAGIVTRVGSKCDLVKPGDRVCMAAIGCMRMFPRADQCAVAKLPDSFNFSEACAAVSPAITAWRALVDVARIRKSDKVLIHAASGGTGQFAIQIARHVGAEIFATVGYSYKKQLLMESYGIPEDHIFYSRNTDFVDGIERLTNGYGVDIVLNSLVGDGLRASWQCIAPYGRFIEIGKADIQSNSQLPMASFAKNVTFSAVDLRHIMLHRHDILAELMRNTMDLIHKGNLRAPAPLHLFKPFALEEAFRYFQSGKNTGRIIIDLDPSSVVLKHVFAPRSSWAFDSSASYLVAGGLGGIGLSVIRWMAKRGAKYLIVPSRKGPMHKAKTVKPVLTELSRQGVTVLTPICDVSSSGDLSDLLNECKRSLPRIKGCINAAMALNDTMFTNMTHSQWERTIRSKVQTSWNLHQLLPNELDFFILLSSISGIIGNPGQSNYAAGCAFQDSLAKHRARSGRAALSIDLGVVHDVGVVAKSEDLRKKITSRLRDNHLISETEILAFLDLYCDPESRLTESSHIMMGLSTPADLLVRGIEPLEYMQGPLFAAHAIPQGSHGNATVEGNVNYSAMFRRAGSAEARLDVVFTFLTKRLARALSIKPEDIDANQALHVFGVDSLVAMEIKNWIAKEFAADVAVFELMGGRSVAAISDLVARMSHL